MGRIAGTGLQSLAHRRYLHLLSDAKVWMDSRYERVQGQVEKSEDKEAARHDEAAAAGAFGDSLGRGGGEKCTIVPAQRIL